MIRAIMWKEFREQGLIGAALLALGAGVLAVVATQADPFIEGASPSDILHFLGTGRLATLMLAVTAGMVCGGAVFAAEREAGTMSFLDSLPATRWQLWQAKLIAGLTLTFVQAVVLLAMASGLGLAPNGGWISAVVLYAFLAFVWGMLGSTAAQTTLGSVGIAIPAAGICAFLATIPVMIFFQRPGAAIPRNTGLLLFSVCMLVTPVLLSGWLFTRADRERREVQSRKSRAGTRGLMWLAGRQLLLPAVVITGFAVMLGLFMLAPDVKPFLVWPVLALLAGSLTGALAFADEQGRGPARFWAEQRLPLGGLWMVKLAGAALFCFWLLAVMTVPLAIRSETALVDVNGFGYGHSRLSAMFGTQLMEKLEGQCWNYLLIGAVYGFAAGHLCGFVFRKFVVAWAVASLVGGAGTACWVPSLLSGGVQFWQLWLPPLVVLLTGRLLMHPWAAERLVARQPLSVLAAGSAAAFAVLTIGIAYRVLEIPDSPHGEDDIAYLAALSSFEENVGGRDFKTAADRYALTASELGAKYDRSTAHPPPLPPTPNHRFQGVQERLESVPSRGWPVDDANLSAWLDQVFASHARGDEEDLSWQPFAASASTLPVGIFEHPQLIGPTGVSGSSLEYARRMSLALLARGLQQQAAGNSADFVLRFREAIVLARTMRNGSVMVCLSMGDEIERTALMSLERWLENMPGRPEWSPVPPGPSLAALLVFARLESAARSRLESLAAVIEILNGADPSAPFDPTPQYLVERHVTREALRSPTQWLPQQLGLSIETQAAADPLVELVSVAWAVPWEKERTRRLVGVGFESGARLPGRATHGRPGSNFLAARGRKPEDLVAIDTQGRAFRRAAILKVALTAYRLRTGRYPNKLEELVTSEWLSRLPVDPYREDHSFGYRVSAGEKLRASPRPHSERMMPPRDEILEMAVPAGQAILWSVGVDHVDQGGVNPPATFSNIIRPPEDLVFLVPMGDGP